MIRASTATLIAALPEAHGVYDAPQLSGAEVLCDVRSVGMREAYEAMSHGLHPEVVLILHDYAEYDGQMHALFEGRLYKVVRTYVRADHAIELTLERVTSHDIPGAE